MTTFLLIRHAVHELGGGTLAGRTPNVHLSPDGLKDAERLGDRLAPLDIKAVYASPMTRTQETAKAVASRHGLEPITAEEIVELDFGDWMGKTLDEVRPLEEWKRFIDFRSGSRMPKGELMLEIQLRVARFMLELCKRHENETVALVSHGDVIKAALAHWAAVPLDLFHRIEISPASVTTVAVSDHGPWILGVNSIGELPQMPF